MKKLFFFHAIRGDLRPWVRLHTFTAVPRSIQSSTPWDGKMNHGFRAEQNGDGGRRRATYGPSWTACFEGRLACQSRALTMSPPHTEFLFVRNSRI